ncbi:hypothetical protein GFC01_13120 [Desulfofundulus thermobenzoicus]|uniref:Uncharacterized protein n=1 Tax=Desulfofundulus thermobenzoicus TaxID=29376 RepID=A0A6N7ITC4_9FIRM|nr:hypothetical protein [Desulfofundulus thermobenzoicus]MQL53181.1 hypothetical protein [Desulfofundulus thermobenzoicus]HHW43190.1 hypothetical protein [Desulfotomaculum sp.]
MEKEVLAAFRAATAQPDYLTTEKFDAILGGFGVFNMGVWAAANVIAREMKKGKKINVSVSNERSTEMDDIAKKVVKTLMDCGADASNAALVGATLLYWAGSSVTAGIPAPNRKLGAVCRMAAGAPAGRVANIPTEKLNNKISGFAAVRAIYEAMDKEVLAPWPGEITPLGVAGSPVTGHTRVGEDILFPELAQKLVKIGVDGMMRAYNSVGIKPCRWMSSLLACAAALEILHPDAYVGEEWGPFLKTRTPYVCGLAAVKAANMPEKIHIRGTGEELETAKVVGDLAMILKDCGQPTVVGMIMFNEVCALIQEGPALGVGRSGGPLLLPLTHWCTSASLALYLLGKGMEEEEIADVIRKTMDNFFQVEHAAVATNILARRANFVERGPITRSVMMATEPVLVDSIYKRTIHAYNGMKSGKTITEITRELEDQRIKDLGDGVARLFSKALGRNIEYVRFYNVRPGAGRRTHKFAQKYFAFDGYVDVELKVDGKVYTFENILAKTIPDAMLANDRETLKIIECFAAGAVDLLNAGAVAMDVVVPACVGAAMGVTPQEAVEQAAAGATISMSIPVPTILESAILAARIARELK